MSYFAKKKKKKKAKGKRKGKAPRKGPRRKGKTKRKSTVVGSSAQQRPSDSALVKLYGAENGSEEHGHEDDSECSFDPSTTLNSLDEVKDYLKKTNCHIDFEVREVAHPCDLVEEATAAMESAEPSPIEDDIISEIKEASRRKLFFVPIESVVTGVCWNIDEMAKFKGVIGFLVCERGTCHFGPFTLTRAALRKFLSVDESADSSALECVVCCEEIAGSKRQRLTCVQCGVSICFVCVAAIAFDNPKLMGAHHSDDSRTARFQCPLCRFERNTTDITSICADIVQCALLDEVTSDKLRRNVIQKAMESKQYKAVVCPLCCAFCDCPLDVKRLKELMENFNCTKCKRVTYCSGQCRDKALKGHEKDCRLWSIGSTTN